MDKEERLAICVSGTDGIDDVWTTPYSDFRRHLELFPSSHSDIPFKYIQPRDRFKWCGKIDGLWGTNDCWRAAANSLRNYIHLTLYSLSKPLSTIVDLYMHSHGGNVVLEGIKNYELQSLRLGNLFFFSTPIRRDMVDARRQMTKYCQRAFYIHGGSRDKWEVRGRFSLVQLYRDPITTTLELFSPGKMPEIPASRNIIDLTKGHSDTLNPGFMILKVWPIVISELNKEEGESL